MLDEALYNLMMETQAAIFAAASTATASTSEASVPPPLLQVNAGRAESPGWFLVQAAEFDPEPLTVADLRIRDVYGAPRIVQALLDILHLLGVVVEFFCAGGVHAWQHFDTDQRRTNRAAVSLQARPVRLQLLHLRGDRR